MFCNKFQSVEEPRFLSRNKFGSRSKSSKKFQWVGESSNSNSHPDLKKFPSRSRSLNKNSPISQLEALKISDDDDEFNGDMVQVDRFSDDEDSDDGKACGFFDDDECEICLRKKGSECTHYEYNKTWKTYNLIVCSICKSEGQHWRRNCPNLKNFKPRAVSDTDPKVYAALLELVSRKSQVIKG